MSGYRRLTESQLMLLGDEELVACVVAAREAGDGEGAKAAAGQLAWGFEGTIRAKVAMKVPPVAVEEVTGEVFVSVLGASFEGKVVYQFRSFLNTIIQRRIADYWGGEERHPNQAPLSSEHEGDDEIWGEGEGSVGDSSETLEILDLIKRVLATRSPLHQRIVELYGPEMIGEDLTGAEVVKRLSEETGETITTANVQQVWHRFKLDLAAELDPGEDGGNPDG